MLQTRMDFRFLMKGAPPGRASIWVEFFGGLFNIKTHGLWEKDMTIRSEI